jgi:hypothetical protein
MCEICQTAGTKLEKFLDQLVAEHPGTTVDGQTVDAEHHMQTALAVTTVNRLEPELREYVATSLAKRHIADKVAQMTGGAGRIGSKRPLLLPRELEA